MSVLDVTIMLVTLLVVPTFNTGRAPLIVNVSADSVAVLFVKVPDVVKLVNVPTLVTLGCAAVDSVPPSVVPVIAPVILILPEPLIA